MTIQFIPCCLTIFDIYLFSIFYVYYEQYLDITKDAVISLSLSIGEIFVVTLLLMGLDFHSAIIMVFTILMILQDLLGLMAYWDISMNAVSLVNLVMVSQLIYVLWIV